MSGAFTASVLRGSLRCLIKTCAPKENARSRFGPSCKLGDFNDPSRIGQVFLGLLKDGSR
jgi:hypothetical protein